MAFHFSYAGKAISCVAFRFSRTGKAISAWHSAFPAQEKKFLLGISLFPHGKSNFLRPHYGCSVDTSLNSTARIPIELGPAFMASSSFFSRRHRPARNRRFCICNGGWNGQSGLRTGIELAPDSQLTSDSPGAFGHCQASRSARPARLRGGPSGRWLSIVAEPQPKLPLAIRDF